MLAASRPDPSKGVFETMLVLDGNPIELAAHLERLSASVGVLYGLELPRSTEAAISSSAGDLALGRLRIGLAPSRGASAETSISTAEIDATVLFPPRERGASLFSLVVAGGLGAHKWADRSLLAHAETADSGMPLLLDGDGTVLEAAKGNVFAVRGDRLRTPPTDGRILPGIVRRRAIEAALARGLEVREEKLSIDDLIGADEAFSTGSIGGLEPVRSLNGIELGRSGEVSAAIGADLRRLWSAPEPAGARALAASRSPDPLAR